MQDELSAEEVDHQKAAREPVAALVIAFILLLIPVTLVFVIFRK